MSAIFGQCPHCPAGRPVRLYGGVCFWHFQHPPAPKKAKKSALEKEIAKPLKNKK